MLVQGAAKARDFELSARSRIFESFMRGQIHGFENSMFSADVDWKGGMFWT